MLNAQTESVKEIRSYYYDLKSRMEADSAKEYPDFYIVRIEENIHKTSVSAVGNYYGESEIWYLPNEKNGDFGRNGTMVYKSSTFQISARKEFTEYVFQNGLLVFCFIKIEDEGAYRYYFKDNRLIEYVSKGVDETTSFYTKEDWETILKYAKD